MSSPRKKQVENTTTSSSYYRPTNLHSTGLSSNYSYPTSNIYHSPKRQRDVVTAHLSPSRYLKPSIEILDPTHKFLKSEVIEMRSSPYKTRDVVSDLIRNSPYRSSPYKTRDISDVRSSPYKSQVLSEIIHDNYEEHNFRAFLKDIIMWENEIERLKCDLALRSDFNLPDAFRVFEVDKRGYFNDLDFKYGANFLDVFPTADEIFLTFKRFTNGGETLFA